MISTPDDDEDLQAVRRALEAQPLQERLTRAVDDAVKYVLDGARTGRFSLLDSEVDSDERASVGTKLQYRVIGELGLVKEPPLDTSIAGVPLELKGTVRDNWMIPYEGQCSICLLIKVDAAQERFSAYLMRTHRAWLRAAVNNDGKRGVATDALRRYSIPLLVSSPLPPEPLRLLTPEQAAGVFAPRVGQVKRLTSLFGFLPDVVIPRTSILTVCYNKADPLRRARQAKEQVFREHGLEVLVETWREDRQRAAELGFTLPKGAWVAASSRMALRSHV